MSIKQQTPQIRFTGFSENWSNLQFFETLDSIVDFRGRTPKKIGLEWSDKGYVALSALNVKNGYIDFSLDNHFGDEELYQKWMGGKELVTGQVLFTTEAPMGNVAQVPDNKGYILSQRTIAFNAKSTVIKNDFLAVLLRSPATFNRLDSMTSGGTAKGVSQKSMAKLEVDIPSDLQEQIAIGNFFQNIDQTIALQRRKYEQTQILKKSLLSKMFPKKGQKQPEIRLEGFSGDWVEKTLRSLVDTVKSYPLSRNFETSDLTAYRYIHYGDIHRGKLKIIESQNLMPNICIGNYELLKKGDLVIADASEDYEGVANPCVINFNLQDKVVAGLHTIALRPINVDSLYLYYKFSTVSFKDHNRFIATGTKVLGISAKNLLKYESYFPETKEQTAIGQFFKQLDDTLSVQAKQLKILDNLKKALLAKMFV